jgi:hypothetical protein
MAATLDGRVAGMGAVFEADHGRCACVLPTRGPQSRGTIAPSAATAMKLHGGRRWVWPSIGARLLWLFLDQSAALSMSRI